MPRPVTLTPSGAAFAPGDPKTPSPGRAVRRFHCILDSPASQPLTEQELGVGDSVEAEGIEATLNEVRILPTTGTLINPYRTPTTVSSPPASPS